MFDKIKKFITKIKCSHDINVVRWHWVHFPDYEPLSVEIEYKCEKCEKIDYLHLFGYQANKWAEIFGNYKKQ